MPSVVQSIERVRSRHVTKSVKAYAARSKAVASVAKKVQATYGRDAIRFLSSETEVDVPCISTGRQELDDWLTGIDTKEGGIVPGSGKGLPKGRIIEIFGPESSGKTTLTLAWIAAVQQAGGVVAFVDAEHAFDPKWARLLGVSTEELLLSQPNNGEEALSIVKDLAASKLVQMIVVDSVAALTPKKEIEGGKGSTAPGQQALMMSQALRKLSGIASRTNTIVVFINQIRHKIGVVFGNPETTPGGNALKFYASVRIDIRKVNVLKKPVKIVLPDGDTMKKEKPWAAVSRVKLVKNKVASPFRETKFLIEFAKGITTIDEGL